VRQSPRKNSNPRLAVDAVISRYGGLSGNKAAFKASLTKSLPVCLWANTLRIAAKDLVEHLNSEGIQPDPIPWSDGAFRIPATNRPGRSWLYKAGLFHIQEEAALLSVKLLAPQSGELILDLCAAPGNKTAQIAIALNNCGSVIANDKYAGRLAPLHAAAARLGLVNVTTTAIDGVNYPLSSGPFDRILVDAPCSGEGIIRKGPGKHTEVPENFRNWLRGTQRALLRRAIFLCRPGGRIVYSTCTFAPEENEEIIDRALKESRDIRLIPPEKPIPGASPGITNWHGHNYSDELSKTVRLWPHKTDTGGFFAAVIEKTGNPIKLPPAKTSDVEIAGQRIIDNFIRYFGFPEHSFNNLHIFRSGRRLKLISNDHQRSELKCIRASGLTLTKDKAKIPKFSTEATLAFGHFATRNAIEIEANSRMDYLARKTLILLPKQIKNCGDNGYVIVRSSGIALGIGILKRHKDGGTLKSLFPKNWI